MLYVFTPCRCHAVVLQVHDLAYCIRLLADRALSCVQALKTITALNKNIAEETLAQIEVGHGLFCKVLTPLQACSAYVGEPSSSWSLECSLEANWLLMWLATAANALGSCFTGLYPFFRKSATTCALLEACKSWCLLLQLQLRCLQAAAFLHFTV